MKRIAATMRHHWQFFLFVPILTIVMTWPTLRYVFEANTMWLPSDDIDLRMKFWDSWYVGKVVAGSADLYYTEYLFYPEGLSLVYHNISVPHMLLMRALQLVLTPTSAFNLCFLLVVFSNAAACYVYLFYLFRDRWLSLFGSVVFGLSVNVIVRPGQPDVNMLATVPLALYCLQRGLAERRNRWIVLAGVLIGLTAFIGLYIFVCLLISVGAFILFQLPGRWKARAFWVSIIVLALAAGSTSFFRVYPMMRDDDALDEALMKGGGREYGSDLLDYFVHRENVVTEFVFASILRQPVPLEREDGYLGYVALVLAAFGLLKSKPRRSLLLWLLLFLTFFVLKLGPYLTINERIYTDIVLPKYHLNYLRPPVFRGFWITAYFHVGILLPLAILAVFGLRRLLAAIPAKAVPSVVIALLALVILETFEPPDSFTVPTDRLNYIEWLRGEERPSENRLINVPFGRGPSKEYALYHAYSGYPHAEGGASRMPSVAFSYLKENALLKAWRDEDGILCLPFNGGFFSQAIDQLRADGFSHAVFHNDTVRDIWFANYSVMSVQPAYEDDYVRLYRLPDLRDACDEDGLLRPGVLLQLAAIMLPDGNPDAMAAQLPPIALPLAYDGLALGPPVSLADEIDIDSLLEDDGIAVAAWYPAHTSSDLAAEARGRLARELKTCDAEAGADGARIEYFTRAEIPCELLFGDEPLAVSYANGALLANAVLRVEGDTLELDLLWNAQPDIVHGASIQAFDRAGEKATNSDFTVHHDPLYRHQLDLSPLAPGDYDIRLILYDFASGVSVSGVVIASDAPFQRELDVGLITID